MRARRSSCWLALAVSAFAQSPAPSTAEPAAIVGSVTHAVTGAPMVNAHVTVKGSGPSAKTYGAMTTAEGKFAIQGLVPGEYQASVERTGFFMPAQPGGRNWLAVSLKANEKKEFVKLQLAPLGSIAGRVVDAKGDPMEGVAVTVDTGQGSSNTAFDSTDEQGRFRLMGLTPGKYRVKAMVPGGVTTTPEIRTDGTEEVRYVPTYFGGVADFKSAARVEVGTGAEVGGVEIAMVRMRHVRISGRVQGVPAETRNVSVIFGQVGLGQRGFLVVLKDGAFELWNVDPGKYVVTATWAAGRDRAQTAPVDVEVGEANLDHLELRVVPPSEVVGSITFEDEGAQPPAPGKDGKQGQTPNAPQGAQGQQVQGSAAPGSPGSNANRAPRVELRTVDPGLQAMPGNGFTSDVGTDGRFQYPAIPATRYRVMLTWPNAWVKSVTLGSQQMDGNVVNLRAGSNGAPLTVVVSSAFGTVSGKVSDASGPAANARVALVREDWISTGDSATTTTDESGGYTFANVRPGKYRVAAVEDGDSGPAYGRLDDYEDVLARLEVEAKGQVSKDLKRHPPVR